MVCVECNSELGRVVDNALVNHHLSKLFRSVHGLRGKATNPPNPFAGEHSLRSDPTQKMQIKTGEGGQLVPYFIPQVSKRELGGGRVRVEISVDATDEPKVEEIARKVATRIGGSVKEALEGAERKVIRSDSEIHVPWAVDTRDYKIGLLKIAFEFAADRIPGYVGCSDAEAIARVLSNGLFDEVERYVNIGNGLDHRIMLPFSELLDYDGVKHYVVLLSSERVCFASFTYANCSAWCDALD